MATDLYQRFNKGVRTFRLEVEMRTSRYCVYAGIAFLKVVMPIRPVQLVQVSYSTQTNPAFFESKMF